MEGSKKRAANKLAKAKRKKRRKPKKSLGPFHEFYQSFEWRKLRYETLKRYGAECMLCGATRADGLKMHVDHIKCLRDNWHLRLDPDNVQVLCELCNHGKGNWDSTDWRPSVP